MVLAGFALSLPTSGRIWNCERAGSGQCRRDRKNTKKLTRRAQNSTAPQYRLTYGFDAHIGHSSLDLAPQKRGLFSFPRASRLRMGKPSLPFRATCTLGRAHSGDRASTTARLLQRVRPGHRCPNGSADQRPVDRCRYGVRPVSRCPDPSVESPSGTNPVDNRYRPCAGRA
jgi:hypothetical protein